MSKSSLAKEMSRLVNVAAGQGFRVKEAKSGWMVYAKEGSGIATIHKTPSRQNAVNRVKNDLRRIGVRV